MFRCLMVEANLFAGCEKNVWFENTIKLIKNDCPLLISQAISFLHCYLQLDHIYEKTK